MDIPSVKTGQQLYTIVFLFCKSDKPSIIIIIIIVHCVIFITEGLSKSRLDAFNNNLICRIEWHMHLYIYKSSLAAGCPG